MSDCERATFVRRLAALAFDIVVVLVLAGTYFVVWASAELGGLPETGSEIAAVAETAPLVMPSFVAQALLVYAVLSFTPLLGRRTVGMRHVGIRVVRDS